MEFNKIVANPMLVGSIRLMKEEDTPEHRNMFVLELQKSSLIAPALIEPEPVENAEGTLVIAPGSKIQFPMIFTSNKKGYFMGFTDMLEYKKWQENNKELPFFALKFEDYVGMLMSKDDQGNLCPALGYVINPYGENIVVPKDLLAGIMATRIAQLRQQAGPEALRNLNITVPEEARAVKKSDDEDKVDPRIQV